MVILKNYILKKDVVSAQGSKIKSYKKGDVVELSEEEVERYEQLGVLQKEPTTVKEIKDVLDEMQVHYPSDAKKSELQDILGATLNGLHK